jgi:hypothetical protein
VTSKQVGFHRTIISLSTLRKVDILSNRTLNFLKRGTMRNSGGTKLHHYLHHLPQTPGLLFHNLYRRVWRLTCCIWNDCVPIANSLQPGEKFDEEHAGLRQIASDLLLQVGNVDGIDSGHYKIEDDGSRHYPN